MTLRLIIIRKLSCGLTNSIVYVSALIDFPVKRLCPV